ncbi:MAG TPA: hypothetical protein VFJ72_06115 [Rubrobacteraceae bacterium]|nr:hypothetical protein [Rubrobacteraceae bacterium]
MDEWHGFGARLSVSQIYETTVMDGQSGLSAHFVVVPSRSLGGDSYLFRAPNGPLEALGLQALADVPAGGVVRSLAACLVSGGVDEFLQRFHEGFAQEVQHASTELPAAFAFAEYITFARVIPFEWTAFSADSLGNVLTAQGRGEAAFASYEETQAPVMVIAIPAGVLICGSTANLEDALEAGLRRRILALVQSNSGTSVQGEESP